MKRPRSSAPAILLRRAFRGLSLASLDALFDLVTPALGFSGNGHRKDISAGVCGVIMRGVLVIDDDEFMLNMVQSCLQEGEFKVLTTADGPQGIELFSRLRPDAVILDLGLPSMDGLQVLKRIKEIDVGARVLVVTGYPSPAAAEAARSLGAWDFLAKPFDPNVLLEKVRTIVSSQD